MNLIPLGEVSRDRYDISVKYGLIEKVSGIWRLTSKCKSNYNPTSYVKYLRGGIDKPYKISEMPVQSVVVQKQPKVETKPKMTPQQEMRSPEYQKVIDEIFNL